MSIPVSPSVPAASSGLPVVNQALEPSWVRHGSAATQKSYQTALAFEEMLVEQLSQSLTATSGLEGESGQEGEASSESGSPAGSAGASPLSSMLPHALASGVMSAGGLGLAAQMTRQLESAAAATTAQQQASGSAGTQGSGESSAAAAGGTSAGSDSGATGGTAA